MVKRAAVLLLLTLGGCAARIDEQPAIDEARYRFAAGETLNYRARMHMSVDMIGTHPDFLVGGETRPLEWTLSGDYENFILRISGGVAEGQRRVVRVESSGSFQGKPFTFAWKRSDEKPQPRESIDKFVAATISEPGEFSVSDKGELEVPQFHVRRLVMTHGMMYWPIRATDSEWTSFEELAVPLIHDKVRIEFRNVVQQDVIRTGYRARIIAATAKLAESEKTEGMCTFGDLKYNLSGKAYIEFDLTHGRLVNLEVDVKIEFQGEGQVEERAMGVIIGRVEFRGSQSLVQ